MENIGYRSLQEIENWAEGIECAVTICDADCTIIYMNARSRATFGSHGDIIGENLLRFHSPASVEKIHHMLSTGSTNTYTVRKNGITKLIFQTPWRRNGEIAGLVEISIPLPENMPHIDRDA